MKELCDNCQYCLFDWTSKCHSCLHPDRKMVCLEYEGIESIRRNDCPTKTSVEDVLGEM